MGTCKARGTPTCTVVGGALPLVAVQAGAQQGMEPHVTPHAPHAAGVKIFVNLETIEKIYTRQGEHMCPMDG